MKEYQEIQRKTEKGGTVAAVVTTVGFHALLVLFGVNSGLTYLSPPPPEQSFVIDFSEEQEKQAVRQQGLRQYRAKKSANCHCNFRQMIISHN